MVPATWREGGGSERMGDQRARNLKDGKVTPRYHLRKCWQRLLRCSRGDRAPHSPSCERNIRPCFARVHVRQWIIRGGSTGAKQERDRTSPWGFEPTDTRRNQDRSTISFWEYHTSLLFGSIVLQCESFLGVSPGYGMLGGYDMRPPKVCQHIIAQCPVGSVTPDLVDRAPSHRPAVQMAPLPPKNLHQPLHLFTELACLAGEPTFRKLL